MILAGCWLAAQIQVSAAVVVGTCREVSCVKASCLVLLCQWSNCSIKLLILLMVACGIIGITKPGELKYISK